MNFKKKRSRKGGLLTRLIRAIKNLFGKLFGGNKKEENYTEYIAKRSLMTECEKKYFEAIKNVLWDGYTVLPQVNLSSVIEKHSSSKYRNELFRIVDFGIFDYSFRPILLIEINDSTHTEKSRIERDIKVKSMCESAGIPIITFWTKYGVNVDYIKKRIEEHL